MKNEKGISKLALLIILVVIIIFNYLLFKYFSKPVTEVLTGGAEYSLPALDKAKKVGDKANKAGHATDEAAKRMEGIEQEN